MNPETDRKTHLLREYAKARERQLWLARKELYETDLSAFAKRAWEIVEPTTELIWSWHLDVICAYLEALYRRRIRNLIINVPPGSMKSLLTSVFAPAWKWTWDPGHRFVTLTNALDLARRDARSMRRVVTDDWFKELWGMELDPDQSGVESFANLDKGFRDSIGFSANITGRRGNTLIIDDPHDAQKAFSDVQIQTGIDTYDQAISSRLNDYERDGKVLIMQRLRTNDLTGHLLAKKQQAWTHVRIPMEYEGEPGYDPVKDLGTDEYHGRKITDPRTKRGELMFPERYSRKTVAQLKEDLGDYGTAGQLQQRPSPLSGGILKVHKWRVWGKESWTKNRPLPFAKHVFMSLDTAYSERDLKETAYSACTTWAVFWDEDKARDCILLLRAWWDLIDYDDLRKRVNSEAVKARMKVGDGILIEEKASGISLLQQIRRAQRRHGFKVRGYDPKPDGDKVARAYLIQPLLAAGLLWIPDKEWARDLTKLVAEFPAGAPPCADLTDTITQAALHLQRGHWLVDPAHEDEPKDPEPIFDDWRNPEPKRITSYG